MKVLLCEDVNKLGWLGDIVQVNEGYARNYLLPEKLAIIPTEENLRSLAEEKAKRAKQRISEKRQLEEAAAAVEGAEAVIARDANEQGRLFGSVKATDIAGNLREQGLLPNRPSDVHRPERSGAKSPLIAFEDGELKVADEIVQLPEHIKEVGSHSVILKFAEASPSEGRAEDLIATVNVVVVALPQVAERRDEGEPTEKGRDDR